MESNWSFFVTSWESNVEACKLDNTEEVSHLWSACSGSLQKALHNKGTLGEPDKEKLLEMICLLAVKKRNNLVNVIQFQKIFQER